MSLVGTIQSLFQDKERTKPIFPVTKVKAVSDDNGVGLDALMQGLMYAGAGNAELATAPLDADTLGGKLPSEYAPAGYGLGGANTAITDWNNATENGWYSGGGNSPTGYAVHGFVIKYTDNYIIQRVWSLSSTTDHGDCHQRVKTINGWQPWEWVNPPMVVGVEYRTTERWNGKVVYTKMLSISNITLNQLVTCDFDINNITSLISCEGALVGNSPYPLHLALPAFVPGAFSFTLLGVFNNANSNKVTIMYQSTGVQAIADDSKIYVTIKYTKD